MSVLIYFLVLVSAEAPSSATRVAQALEFIQMNEKEKALKLLEKAFEVSQDASELTEICTLILEVSPPSYPKRDAYLRYLAKNRAENPEAPKWFKELGDRALDRGKIEEAEDWYLRALNSADDKTLIEYKLAFVKWNLKQPIEALRLLLEVFVKSEASLQAQVKKDIPKLWWEIGALPSTYFDKITAFSEADLSDILQSLFGSLPKALGAKESLVLVQLKENDTTRPALLSFIRAHQEAFRKEPCFLFSKLLSPEDDFPTDLLLACIKSKDHPSAERLLSFFARLQGSDDEKALWAQSELTIESGKKDEALVLVFDPKNFDKRSKDFLGYVEHLLLQLDEAEFRNFYERGEPKSFEDFLAARPSPRIMDRLQLIDGDRWIPYEEKSQVKAVSKAFLLKKGVWLSRKSELSISDLQQTFDKLLTPPLSSTEKSVAKTYLALKESAKQKLPDQFSKKFIAGFDRWVRKLDQFEASLSSAPADWQIIAKPIFQIEIRRNVEAILSQLEKVDLDPKLSELASTFEQKKAEIKQDLQNRFSMTEEKKP